MIVVQVWVEGTTALLQHKLAEGALEDDGTRSNMAPARPNPRDVAEKAAYRLPNGNLAVPGTYFARMMREAAGAHKLKGTRKSAKYVLPAAVLVLDELCGLYLNDRKTPLTDYEVDSRAARIPSTGGLVMRHRPRLNEWSCLVRLRIKENILSENFVRQVFMEGGDQQGVGDYRPSSGGSFGMFQIVEWQVVSDPKPKTVAQQHASA